MTNGKSTNGTAVVTGASAGIGAKYAERLAERGFDLVLVARRTDRLEALAETLRTRFGVTVRAVTADLGDRTQLEGVARQIGGDETLTLLVNNAGTSTLAPVSATDVAAAETMNDLNIGALVRLTLAVLPGMKSRDRGAIVNIGSVLGFRALPISTIYSATKAYVTFFTRGLIDELADTNVRVQLVAPAATATDIWEISGVPLTALDPATVMSVDAMVDASIAGLDASESVTMPSVEESERLLADFDAATLALLGASQTSAPASRYAIAAE